MTQPEETTAAKNRLLINTVHHVLSANIGSETDRRTGRTKYEASLDIEGFDIPVVVRGEAAAEMFDKFQHFPVLMLLLFGPPAADTAALISRLQGELEASKKEAAHVRLMLQERTQAGDNWYEGMRKAERECHEQRARAEKVELALGAEVERCIAITRLLAERTRERDEARACYGSVCAQLSEQKQSYAKLLDFRDRLTRERDNAREQLAKLEWAGPWLNASPELPGYDRGPAAPTCIECRGVKPEKRILGNFPAADIGHRPTCWFAKKDKQVTIPAKTLKADDVAFCVRFRTDGLPGTAIVMKQETVSVTVTESEPARCSLCLEPDVTGKPHPHARCKDRDSSTREPARPEPRFRVGEKVIWRDKEAVITWAEWFPPVRVWCYGSTYSSSPMPEPELKPAPKFAVGELVTLGGGEAGEIRSREWTMNRWHYRVNDLLCAEHCIAAQTPQHKHDCKGGVFLGRMGNKDLYYSTVGSGFVGGPWLVVIGNRLYHECNIDRPTGPEHDEARRRAVARGLVK